MDNSEVRTAEVVDIAEVYCRRHGIGNALMRRQRFSERRGYIACTRVRLAQELAEVEGKRQPHW